MELPRQENKRWRRKEEVEPGELASLLEPHSAATEDYRNLRTSLMYAQVGKQPKVITVTSSNPGEGKSTVCANLGVVLAQAGKNTLVVDCDLRRPMIHKLFGLRNLRGMVDILADERSMQEVYQEMLEGLKIVTAGPPPPNPSELLSSERFAEFLEEARQEFDYVLVDTPPVRMVSDSAIIATKANGALLVIDVQSTRKRTLRQSVRSLEAVGAKVLGTVMNNIKASKKDYFRYGY